MNIDESAFYFEGKPDIEKKIGGKVLSVSRSFPVLESTIKICKRIL